jgi:hypothetical protein
MTLFGTGLNDWPVAGFYIYFALRVALGTHVALAVEEFFAAIDTFPWEVAEKIHESIAKGF